MMEAIMMTMTGAAEALDMMVIDDGVMIVALEVKMTGYMK